MNKYEMIIILDPSLKDDAVNNKMSMIEKWINEENGKVMDKKDRGIQKLAHEINKTKQGHYALMTFEIDPVKLDKISEEMKLDESIWRKFIKRIRG